MAFLDEVGGACLNIKYKDDFDGYFSIHTPWNRLLRQPWVVNV